MIAAPAPASVRVFVTALFCALACPPPALRAQAEETELSSLIRGRVEALRAGAQARAGTDRLLARQALPTFYEVRSFEPAWVGTSAPAGRIQALVAALAEVERHGLDPADYHRSAIERLRSLDVPSAVELADLELLASDAFLVAGSHLLHGRVDPESVDPEWTANRRSARMEAVLAAALEDGSIGSTLSALAPRQPRYRAVLDALERLRGTAAAGGWPTIPDGPKLEAGVEGPRVARLRDRLRASLDLTDDAGGGESPEDEVFDQPLAAAVRRFQARHGLEADGVVGPATLEALNVPAEERARQLALNLERWRWLPDDLGERHVEVNIAGFDVRVVERGETVRRHRAVVGRQYRQTPMFTGTMTYLVLSPYWHVPPTIAALDKLPVIRQDPGAIAAQRMTLLSQATNEPVDPSAVDWQAMTGTEFNRRYRLRQDPGPANALGSVKFMFPNRHNVYLHDTPTRELFERASRSFSSGCIRIDDPLGLAEYLLADQPDWGRARIDRTVAEGVERTVRLRSPLPVHLLYWTAWAEADGVIHFRTDIYGRDQAVAAALDAPPPGL